MNNQKHMIDSGATALPVVWKTKQYNKPHTATPSRKHLRRSKYIIKWGIKNSYTNNQVQNILSTTSGMLEMVKKHSTY